MRLLIVRLCEPGRWQDTTGRDEWQAAKRIAALIDTKGEETDIKRQLEETGGYFLQEIYCTGSYAEGSAGLANDTIAITQHDASLSRTAKHDDAIVSGNCAIVLTQ